MSRIVPQKNSLFSISVAGEVVEIDLTHEDALRALNLYNQWEIIYA